MSVDVTELFKVWNSHMSNADAAASLGVSGSKFYSLGCRYGLGRRTHIQALRARAGRPEPVITEAEFEARRAEVQAKWSPEEREKRRVGPTARPWRLPSYAFDGRVCAFSELDE